MKPGDPDVFVAALAAVLADYPLGLVSECADPRTGIARTLKFLSIAELVEWLDKRLAHHRALANHVPRPPALPPPVYSEEHKATMREKIAALIRSIAGRPDPVDVLRRAARERAQEA
jgi:hypothetical protein